MHSTLSESSEFGLNEEDKPAESWARYIFGVCREVQKRGGKIGGFDTVFAGDVPLGAGMSSSAALESTYAFALNDLYSLRHRQVRTGEDRPVDRAQLLRRELRHHGPVRFGFRQEGQPDPSGLPFAGVRLFPVRPQGLQTRPARFAREARTGGFALQRPPGFVRAGGEDARAGVPARRHDGAARCHQG